jgi:hypothetical protein
MSGATQLTKTVEYPEHPLLVIENSLYEVHSAARLLGHMNASVEHGRVIGSEELAAIQSMLDTAHADIAVHWEAMMDERRGERAEHREALAALRTELETEKKKRAVPGSAEDIRHAQWIWRFLRNAASVAIEECDKFDPSGVPLVKKPVRRRAKR